jgi:predicted nucleic acid-binding protein
VIYLDSCILIYALEDQGPVGDRIRHELTRVQEPIAASPLVLHECLVKPLRDGDLELRARFTAAYERMVRVEIDENVFLQAAELRARHGLKAADALHLAAALVSGCRQLWTNDVRLSAASRGLAIDVVRSGGDSPSARG